MTLQISVKDDKAELFLQLLGELKNGMIDTFKILSPDAVGTADTFDEVELMDRVEDVHLHRVTPLSREEVFDGIC